MEGLLTTETWKSVTGFILLICLILVTAPFERRYSRMVTAAAANPAIRFAAGLALVLLASQDVILAGLAFVVIFVWIADIHLLTNSLITDRSRNVSGGAVSH